MARAGQNNEILNIIDTKFISNSVAGGHPCSAVRANLELALNIATKILAWPSLARISELYRSMTTCFEEKLLNMELYGEAYLELFGPKKMAERLLYNGTPTYGREAGLVLCSLCESYDIAPPWKEYLELKRLQETANREATRADFCAIQGRIKLDGLEEMQERVGSWLFDNNQAVDGDYFAGIIQEFLKAGGTDSIQFLLQNPKLKDKLKFIIQIELLRYYKRNELNEEAKELGSDILKSKAPIEAVWECLSLELPKDQITNYCPDLIGLTKSIVRIDYISEKVPVHTWVYGVGIAASTDQKLFDK